MSRRQKSTPLEDLIELFSTVPWWAGVAVALVLFLVLHGIASIEIAPKAGLDAVTPMMLKSMAGVAQYGVPMFCLLGAAVSAVRQFRRQRLVADVSQSKAADVLDGMSWREFESLVGEAFRLREYQVMETGGGGADGGVDLVLTKGGEKFLVQCKQWKAYRVSVEIVRELYGVMAAQGAAGGFVVTSGRFTEDAVAFASGRNVKLVEGPELLGWIRQVQGVTRPDPRRTADAKPVPNVYSKADSAPKCPVCSAPMLRRTARRGANAGSAFWGCSNYPTCRSTRQLVE